jgi:hypothetical protein
VVVGTRRRDDAGDLLARLGPDAEVVDLDAAEYFAEEDLAAYALATLQLRGDERAGNPYADPAAAVPVAARIAALAQRNFLVAGLVARQHGLHDTATADPQGLAFPADVDAALAEYLERLPPVGPAPAGLLLTALAYAHSLGLTTELWSAALAGLGVTAPADELARFAASSAANFLIESSADGTAPRFRLFHQALHDALLRVREDQGLRPGDQRALAEALIAHGCRRGWASADPYLLRSLPAHAAQAGMLDELLGDDDYLLHADLPRLLTFANHATSAAAHARARLLWLTPRAAPAGPAKRAALLSVTAVLEGLPDPFAARWTADAPYHRLWAVTAGRVERTEQVLLASAGDDETVRLWDPVPARGTTSRRRLRRTRHAGEPRPRSAWVATVISGAVTASDDIHDMVGQH